MADMMRSEPFASVYVLDAHFQYKDVGVVNIFNSPAGRAVVSRTDSPEKKNKTHNQKTFCSNRLPNNDTAKFVLNPETLISDDLKIRNYNIFPPPIDYASLQSNQRDVNQPSIFSDSANSTDISKSGPNSEPCASPGFIGRTVNITRSNSQNSQKGKKPSKQEDRTKSEEEKKKQACEDVRIDGGNLLKKRRFSEEKCDILRRLVSSFLSGWSASGSTEVGRWRKRKSSEELYREASLALGIPCELTDSCRCLECQCHYFDCGDTDSDTSDMSINLYDVDDTSTCDRSSSTNQDVFFYEDETSYGSPERQASLDEEEEGDERQQEVGIEAGYHSSEGGNDWRNGEKSDSSAAAILKDGGDLAPTIEIAAGTPVILDHLLNNPMACVLQ